MNESILNALFDRDQDKWPQICVQHSHDDERKFMILVDGVPLETMRKKIRLFSLGAAAAYLADLGLDEFTVKLTADDGVS